MTTVHPPHTHFSSATYRDDRARVVGALDAACATRKYESHDVDDAVRQFARDARRGGLPPEAMIVALKALIEDVGLADMGTWFRDVIRNRAVACAIEAYFAAGGGEA